MTEIKIKPVSWVQGQDTLKPIRRKVFIEEQHVPEELEWDDFDTQSVHFLAYTNNTAIATARLKPDGQIGRIAVVNEFRNKGIGKELLSTVISYAKTNGYNMVYLHSQQQVIGFYQQYGFVINGPGFTDAGISHQAMYKVLDPTEL
ncbi:MAG: GNAT family N-acetyltransferase [Gammaproteobacteria bacterium]|nr:GNAT family N-acetyltransferase [Gammaproteobacteria bacterium]